MRLAHGQKGKRPPQRQPGALLGIVDLPRVRRALGWLDELAAAHTHLLGATGPDNTAGWMVVLEDNTMEHNAQFALRLPASVIERLDALAERLRHERPGLRMSRADVTRMLIIEGLSRAENSKESTAGSQEVLDPKRA